MFSFLLALDFARPSPSLSNRTDLVDGEGGVDVAADDVVGDGVGSGGGGSDGGHDGADGRVLGDAHVAGEVGEGGRGAAHLAQVDRHRHGGAQRRQALHKPTSNCRYSLFTTGRNYTRPRTERRMERKKERKKKERKKERGSRDCGLRDGWKERKEERKKEKREK